MAKQFYREAAMTYAKQHKIAETKVLKKMDDDELAAAIAEWMKDQKTPGRFFCEECLDEAKKLNYKQGGKHKGKPILDDDVFCWYCGKDVADEGKEGGFGKFASGADAPTVPEKKKEEKKEDDNGVRVDDNTGEDEKESEEDEKPEETPEEDEKSEEAPGEDADGVSLSECTDKILGLARKSGGDAHEIGLVLMEVDRLKLWKEKYGTYGEYCAKDLHMSPQMIYAYMRISGNFTLEEASGVPIFSLVEIAKLEEKSERKKALKAVAKGADTKAVKALVSEMRGSEPDPKKKKAEPTGPFSKKHLGSVWSGPLKDGRAIAETGKGLGLEITVLKSKIKVEVIELEDEEAE